MVQFLLTLPNGNGTSYKMPWISSSLVMSLDLIVVLESFDTLGGSPSHVQLQAAPELTVGATWRC